MARKHVGSAILALLFVSVYQECLSVDSGYARYMQWPAQGLSALWGARPQLSPKDYLPYSLTGAGLGSALGYGIGSSLGGDSRYAALMGLIMGALAGGYATTPTEKQTTDWVLRTYPNDVRRPDSSSSDDLSHWLQLTNSNNIGFVRELSNALGKPMSSDDISARGVQNAFDTLVQPSKIQRQKQREQEQKRQREQQEKENREQQSKREQQKRHEEEQRELIERANQFIEKAKRAVDSSTDLKTLKTTLHNTKLVGFLDNIYKPLIARAYNEDQLKTIVRNLYVDGTGRVVLREVPEINKLKKDLTPTDFDDASHLIQWLSLVDDNTAGIDAVIDDLSKIDSRVAALIKMIDKDVVRDILLEKTTIEAFNQNYYVRLIDAGKKNWLPFIEYVRTFDDVPSTFNEPKINQDKINLFIQSSNKDDLLNVLTDSGIVQLGSGGSVGFDGWFARQGLLRMTGALKLINRVVNANNSQKGLRLLDAINNLKSAERSNVFNQGVINKCNALLARILGTQN